MLRSAKSLPKVGIVGCKLLNGDLTVQTSCIQRFPSIIRQVLEAEALRRGFQKARFSGIAPLFSASSAPAPVEVVSGACMLIDRAVFERVGMFSEDYFMYAEDLDLCYRVIQAGYQNYYVGEGVVVHFGGKSSTPQWATAMKWNALLRFMAKNKGPLYVFMFRAVMILVAIARLMLLVPISAVKKREGPQYSSALKWRTILSTLLRQHPTRDHGKSPLHESGPASRPEAAGPRPSTQT